MSVKEAKDDAEVRQEAPVHEVAGRAMAAVLLDKPQEAVTREEAMAALADYAAKGDSDLTWRAVRAGVRAVVLKLEPQVFPEALAGELIGALNALDDGEARGLATPAKARREKGKPSRYGPPSRRHDLGQWLVTETGFQAGLLDLSFDANIGLTTGVTRDGEPSPHGPTPLLPLPMKWDAARRFVDEARKRKPELWDAAVAQGVAEARGEPLDPTFASYRLDYLALAKDRDAWRSILTKAGLMRRRRKRRRRS
jgi:hypothetical protein